MDTSQLRLILLLLGVALIGGIYLWDRLKNSRLSVRRSAPRVRRQPSLYQEDTEDTEDSDDSGDSDDSDPYAQDDALESAGDAAMDSQADPLFLTPLDEVNAEEHDSEQQDSEQQDSGGADSEDLEFSAQGETDYLHGPPDLETALPKMLLQINLVSRHGPIRGKAILEAADETQLGLGEMDIFHRYDDRRPDYVLFSMASQHEPGSFPVGAMSDYETHGLTLFTQLPGLRDGMVIYSDMLFTAERLAVIFDAELQDETHSILTKQAIEHTREQILEYRRKMELERRRA